MECDSTLAHPALPTEGHNVPGLQACSTSQIPSGGLPVEHQGFLVRMAFRHRSHLFHHLHYGVVGIAPISSANRMRPTDSAARLSIHPLDHLAEVTSPQIYYGENAAAHSAEPADLGFPPSALGDLLPLAHSKRPPLALPSQPDLPSDPEGYPLEAPHRLAFPLAVDFEAVLPPARQ